MGRLGCLGREDCWACVLCVSCVSCVSCVVCALFVFVLCRWLDEGCRWWCVLPGCPAGGRRGFRGVHWLSPVVVVRVARCGGSVECGAGGILSRRWGRIHPFGVVGRRGRGGARRSMRVVRGRSREGGAGGRCGRCAVWRVRVIRCHPRTPPTPEPTPRPLPRRGRGGGGGGSLGRAASAQPRSAACRTRTSGDHGPPDPAPPGVVARRTPHLRGLWSAGLRARAPRHASY